MKIRVMSKIGFCYGVERSIKLVKDLVDKNYPKPYYLLGMLVHNDIVNNELKELGFEIIDVNQLDLYLKDKNPKTFISTAHGISIENREKIAFSGFPLIDTTCPKVLKNNEKIIDYYNKDYDIIYIGKKNHQESNALNKYIHLIETSDDLIKLNLSKEKKVLVNQTTVSLIEIENITKLILNKYPNCLIDTCICPATKERQDEVLKEVRLHHNANDIWLIIGDSKSNNTKKLVEIISIYCNNYYFIDNISQLEKIDFTNSNIYITSGTSTPNSFIDQIINKLKGLI